MNTGLHVSVNLSTREALYTPSAFHASAYGLSKAEPTKVDVFGLFQVKYDEDIDAYFVIELPDGRCCYAAVREIQFIKHTEDI